MELTELTHDEDLALVGLLREVVQADADYTDEERASIFNLRREMGEERFDQAVAEAREKFKSRGELKDFAKTIDRQQARQLIYDTLHHVAESDGIDQQEEKPLRWLASWWGLES